MKYSRGLLVRKIKTCNIRKVDIKMFIEFENVRERGKSCSWVPQMFRQRKKLSARFKKKSCKVKRMFIQFKIIVSRFKMPARSKEPF